MEGLLSFRAALDAIAPGERDAWVDRVLGIDEVPDDGPALPRGCVPYLPCPVAAVVGAVDQAGVGPDDVFVDVGAGIGRVTALVELLTGAATIGVEIQPALAHAARALATRVGARRSTVVEGDVAELPDVLARGSVFFLYCPFSGARLERFLDGLEPRARTRRLHVCSVDLPLPPRPWLTPLSPPGQALAVYRSLPLPASTMR